MAEYRGRLHDRDVDVVGGESFGEGARCDGADRDPVAAVGEATGEPGGDALRTRVDVRVGVEEEDADR